MIVKWFYSIFFKVIIKWFPVIIHVHKHFPQIISFTSLIQLFISMNYKYIAYEIISFLLRSSAVGKSSLTCETLDSQVERTGSCCDWSCIQEKTAEEVYNSINSNLKLTVSALIPFQMSQQSLLQCNGRLRRCSAPLFLLHPLLSPTEFTDSSLLLLLFLFAQYVCALD